MDVIRFKWMPIQNVNRKPGNPLPEVKKRAEKKGKENLRQQGQREEEKGDGWDGKKKNRRD